MWDWFAILIQELYRCHPCVTTINIWTNPKSSIRSETNNEEFATLAVHRLDRRNDPRLVLGGVPLRILDPELPVLKQPQQPVEHVS